MKADFETDIRESLKVLKAGGVILYPTDTIWGLGCDATNQAAVKKIFSIKSRSENKSLIVLVDSMMMLERYVRHVPQIAAEIVSVAGSPITIIYTGSKNLANGVSAEDGSVGIRVTSDPFCSSLISRFRKPLVSTSANISGITAPAHFGEISKELTDVVDYSVRYRQNDRQKHKASPVIKVDINGTIKIIRP